MRFVLAAALAGSLATFARPVFAQTVPVPPSCTPEVNQQIATLMQNHARRVDNVLVCGTTFGPSRPQEGGPHGGHQLIPLRVPLPDGTSAFVEVVTNDELDGRVTAPKGATVFAYGQYFPTRFRQRPFVGGIHEVHCSTHAGANDGWVVVDGTRYPRRACSR